MTTPLSVSILPENLPTVTGLTPGTYTNATVMVDAMGRVTAIASGTAGGGVYPGPVRGSARFETPGIYDFPWPAGVDSLVAEIHGAGASGGGSLWVQLAGAGGSGAYLRVRILRPASGHSEIIVGAGGAAVPANTHAFGNDGGLTSVDAIYRCFSSGAGGQWAASAGVGGDGGTPGIASAPQYICWVPGGMGGASAPVDGAGLNRSHPKGADAPYGGRGGNNGQGGMFPGGGGAPGNHDFASGRGGDGQVILVW